MTELVQCDHEKHPIGIAEMERQHHAIVELMNDLFRRDAERAPKAELLNRLIVLSDCTLRHFKDEEAYMARTGYSKLDVHQVIHRDLLLKLEEHVNRFESGSGRLGADLLSFLKFWLFAHVTGFDRQSSRQPGGHPANWPERAGQTLHPGVSRSDKHPRARR